MDTAQVAVKQFEEAALLRDVGDARAARKAALALALFERCDGPQSLDAINARLLLGGTHLDRGDAGAALDEAKRSIALLPRASSKVVLRLRANALLLASSAAAALGVYKDALRYADRAHAVADNHLARADKLAALNAVGVACRYLGRYARAERCYREALAVAADAGARASLWHNLAGLAHERGELSEAETSARRAVRLRERALGEDHPTTAADVAELAAVLQARGNHAEALPLYARAIRIFEATLGEDHFEVGFNLGNLAALHQHEGRFAKARKLYVRAIQIEERAVGRAHPDVALLRYNFAALCREEGATAEATTLLRAALPVLRKQLGSAHQDTKACAEAISALRRAGSKPSLDGRARRSLRGATQARHG